MDQLNYWKKPLTTAELLDEIERLEENDEIPSTIYITPPDDNDWQSDEDSGDESCNDPNRLNSKQLNCRAETNLDADRNDSDHDNNLTEKERHDNQVETKQKKIQKKRNWIIGDLQKGKTQQIGTTKIPIIPLSSESDPLEFLKLFLNHDILEHLVKNTVQYAAMKNCRFELENDEMLVFIAILYLSGYVPVPRRRMFWEVCEDVRNTLVYNSIRRNRFEEIFRFIHAADNNNLLQGDKMAKLRPLMNKINDAFIRFTPINSFMSIDESMIPYFGRNGCKQFIRGKPIRFGYKAWVLALPSGYCVNFDIYQGRNRQANETLKMGLGESVVMNFANLLNDNFTDIEFSLFFDNFFTSASLIHKLGDLGFGATGTVRENRTDKCPIDSNSLMKKKERGAYTSAIDAENNIVCVKWNDNNVVTLLSNEYGVTPVRQAARYSAKDKAKIEIPQPNVVSCYNKFMGGVDLMDNNVSNYRIGFRGKKWYIPIMFWIFDVCMNNAWILSRKFGKTMDNLEFRRAAVISILQKYGRRPLSTGPSSSFISPASRQEGQHLIIISQNRRRCASCKSKTTKACNRCGVALHDKCFLNYHK